MKIARTVLRGGKTERSYLSQQKVAGSNPATLRSQNFIRNTYSIYKRPRRDYAVGFYFFEKIRKKKTKGYTLFCVPLRGLSRVYRFHKKD